MRLVIDCNIFVACLSSKSDYHKIFESLINNEYELLITTDIIRSRSHPASEFTTRPPACIKKTPLKFSNV